MQKNVLCLQMGCVINSIAIDIHEIVKRVKDASFSDQQAEIMTDVMRESQESGLDERLVKNELKNELLSIRHKIKTKILSVKKDISDIIAPVKSDVNLLIWMVGFILAISSGIFLKLMM